MTSLPPVPRPPTRAGRALARRTLVLAAGVLVGWAAFARPARADEADDVRAKILGTDEAARAKALEKLEGRAALIGAVLGPILRGVGAGDGPVRAAAWLTERSDNAGGFLLAEDVLRRSGTDPAFARALSTATKPAAWRRVVDTAKAALASPSAADDVRLGAVACLAADPTVASLLALVATWAGGDTDARPGTPLADVARAARDAVRERAAFPFTDPLDARKRLTPLEDRSLADALRSLSAEKDTAGYPAFLRMVRESKATIDRTTRLAELLPYLSPRETPWADVRRLAAEHATKVEATAQDWIAAFSLVLRDEDDPTTLTSLLRVASTLPEGLRSAELADAIVGRLAICCAMPGVPQGLLDLLAKVGDRNAVEAAQPAAQRATDLGVLEAWLRAAAAVGDLDERICAIHQSLAGKTDERSIAARVHALEALGTRRGTAWNAQAVAVRYLYGILRRDEADAITASMPKETAPAARAAAIRSLEAFPEAGTYRRLRALAEAPPESIELAQLAVSVLAQLGAKDPAAIDPLLEVVTSPTEVAVRQGAILGLARIATDAAIPTAATPEAVQAAREAQGAVRRRVAALLQTLLVDPATPFPLRAAAADAAGTLGDPQLVEGVVAVVVAARDRASAPERAAVSEALDRLVLAGVHAGRAGDGLVETGLTALATSGERDLAIRLADAAAEAAGGRAALQTLRAALRTNRARATVDVAGRRADLVDAHRILRSTLKSAPGDEEGSLTLRIARAAHLAVVEDLLKDADLPENVRRSVLFSGLAAATGLRDAASIRRAAPWLGPATAYPERTPDELAILTQFAAAVAGQPTPPAVPR